MQANNRVYGKWFTSTDTIWSSLNPNRATQINTHTHSFCSDILSLVRGAIERDLLKILSSVATANLSHLFRFARLFNWCGMRVHWGRLIWCFSHPPPPPLRFTFMTLQNINHVMMWFNFRLTYNQSREWKRLSYAMKESKLHAKLTQNEMAGEHHIYAKLLENKQCQCCKHPLHFTHLFVRNAFYWLKDTCNVLTTLTERMGAKMMGARNAQHRQTNDKSGLG